MIVAIDGPAGAGKSTIAREVARALDFQLIDTGAIYRAVALSALESGVALDDAAALARLAASMRFAFTFDGAENELLCDGRPVGDEIRAPRVSEAASLVSAHAPVREVLLAIQRRLGRRRSSVLEGRDIGSVVFPDAEIKVFLTADPAERAQRRARQLREQGVEVDDAALARELRARDARDQGRAHAPLIEAPGAHRIESDGRTIEQIRDEIVELARQKGA